MNIAGVVGFVLLASVKFMVAPLAGFAADLNFLETFIGMVGGGILGVTTFYYLSNFFFERARIRKMRKRAAGRPVPRSFTWRNKRIVKLKKRLGFYGVVFIALPFVSLPIEGIVCAKFFRHEKRLIPLLYVSVIIWSFLLTGFFELFYDDVAAWF